METTMPALLSGRRPALAAVILALLLATFALAPGAARAQAVLATVNNTPITSFDVDQRIRLAGIVDRRKLDRKSALRELVDDQVKMIEARRIGFRVTEEGVQAEMSKLARANRQSDSEFENTVRRFGVEPRALRDKIRADIIWSTLLRDRARRGSHVSNAELESEVAARRKDARPSVEFELRSILFIVPRGAAPGAAERAAAAFRARFSSCETGFDQIADQKDVAVRQTIFRNSDDLSKPLVALLDKTPIGKMTPPSRSAEGIEMIAVCGRKERDNTANLRQSVAAEISERKITENTRGYIEELRKKADIRYR